MTNPPTNTTAPHSCQDICSRKRHTCSHSCPLPCHPGPCPPCQVALVVPCPSHNYPLTVKCHMSSNKQTSLTPVCGTDCARELSCGNMDHVCDSPCHYGPCRPCDIKEVVRCYCGKHDKEVACGWNKDKELFSTKIVDGVEEHWKGRYNCGEACDQFFDCGVHPCKEVSPGLSFNTTTKANVRHVTHIRSYPFHALTRRPKSHIAHAEPPIFAIYRITHDQTASLQSRHAASDARKKGSADISVLGHVTRGHVHLVTRKWSGLVDVENLNLWWDVMY